MPTGTLTISQYVANPPQQVDANSTLEVRGWYTRDYISIDGVTPIFGNSTSGEQGPYYSITPTLNGSGEIVVPAHIVQITVGANPTANYFEGLWIDGAFVMLLLPNTQGATGWQIPSVYGDPIAYDEIATYNRAKRLVYPPATYFTADQVIQEIRRLAGNFDYAAVNVNGITSMSVAPDVASLPIALGANDVRVVESVTTYTTVIDGTTDNTAAVQDALDALPASGGVVFFPRNVNSYVVGELSIDKPDVTIKGEGWGASVIKRLAGSAPGTLGGGIFNVIDQQPANFRVEDIGFDLQRASYPAGTANTAVHALRSTFIYVNRVKVVDSSEQFFKFRDSASVYVDRVWCDNAYADGLEFSFTDTGAGIPDFEYYSVTNSFFSRVDIGNFGTSSGTAVTGNGSGSLPINTPMRYFKITGNTFSANLRDIHFESQSSGSHFEGGIISGNQFTDAILASIILGGVKDFIAIDNTIRNPGLAGSVAITDTAGIIITQSTGQLTERTIVALNTIIDDRASATNYCEYGIKVSAAESVSIMGNQIKAGANVAGGGNLCAAIDIAAVTGKGIICDNTCVGVATPIAKVGIGFSGSGNSGTFSMSGNNVTGFTANYSNVNSLANNWATADRQSLETLVTDVILDGPASAGVRRNTIGGGDVDSTQIAGGGAFSDGRGALIIVNGLDAADAGDLELRAGAGASGGRVSLQSDGSEKVEITPTTTNIKQPLTSSVVTVFGNGDTTPTVTAGNEFTASNAAPTSITTFDNGLDTQTISILFTNGNTTLVDGATLVLAGSANFVGSADDFIVLKNRGGIWFEVCRSVN